MIELKDRLISALQVVAAKSDEAIEVYKATIAKSDEAVEAYKALVDSLGKEKKALERYYSELWRDGLGKFTGDKESKD